MSPDFPPAAAGLRVEQAMGDLPAPTPAVTELLGCDPRSEDFHARVLAIVERQSALASRILAIANRMEAARAEPVGGLAQAVARVGAGRIARLIVLNVLLRALPLDSAPVRRVWCHALLAASAARELARSSGRATHSHEAFVAGLLHDVGCFVLARGATGEDEQTTEPSGHEAEGWDAPLAQLEAERRVYGYDHTQLGERVCRAWSLPQELIWIVRLHHATPPLPVELDGRLQETLRIVQQGDRLASLLLARPRLRELRPEERLALLERACVHPAWEWTPAGPTQLDLLVDPVLRRYEERRSALGLVGA
jgi:HD-like signal output (HDOD) protein